MKRSTKNFLKTTGLLWLLGFIGIIASLMVMLPLIEAQLVDLPNAPSKTAIAIAQVIQGAILLALLVAVGTFCAPRVGLRSRLAALDPRSPTEQRPLVGSWRWTVGLGTVVPLLTLLLDRLMAPWLPQALQQQGEASWKFLVAGILYGGITEELLLRWGVMSLLAWLLWKVFDRKASRPGVWLMGGAIALSALLFGLGHLPATAMLVSLTPLVIVRALLLNGLAALVFGWLFWRFDLESAMAAHMLFHVVSFAVLGLT